MLRLHVHSLVLALAALTSAACASTVSAAEPAKVRLFILSGQSNMAGLNPDLSFTPAVKQAFPQDEVIVVKHAQGGQPIVRWYKKWQPPASATSDKGAAQKDAAQKDAAQKDAAQKDVPAKPGDLYDQLLAKVRAAVGEKRPETIAFVWMQGERDAKAGWHSVYADSMRGLVAQLRNDLQRPDTAFVIGRLSDHLNGTEGWDVVRKAQETVAASDPLGAWVDTDDLNNIGDKQDLHYTKDGYVELGKRFAAKAVEVMQKAAKKP